MCFRLQRLGFVQEIRKFQCAVFKKKSKKPPFLVILAQFGENEQKGSIFKFLWKSENVTYKNPFFIFQNKQAISRGLSTSDSFSRKELSKYRFKPPKYIVRGTTKKPDKTRKNGGSHKFSTGPQLSEYVQVVYRNTN